MMLTFIMNYPSLYGETYTESANKASAGIEFVTNDLLLALMIFIRLIYFIRWVLSISVFTEPRA